MPSATYTCHGTLLTGRLPEGHRVWSGLAADPRPGVVPGWAGEVRVTTVEIVDGHPVIPWGSARLPVALNGGVPAGSSVLAVWRPEAASVIDPSQAPLGTLRGQVELVTFLGPITRLDVRIDDDTDLVLVDLVSGTARNIAAGQEVALSVPPDAIRLYA